MLIDDPLELMINLGDIVRHLHIEFLEFSQLGLQDPAGLFALLHHALH